jgi:hypothetical protein
MTALALAAAAAAPTLTALALLKTTLALEEEALKSKVKKNRIDTLLPILFIPKV